MTPTTSSIRLIEPYGGTLVDRIVPMSEIPELERRMTGVLTLEPAAEIHFRNIATGCYSPLTGFMSGAEYRSVIRIGKLPDGQDWKVPVLLHADALTARDVREGMLVALTDQAGSRIGAIDVRDIFEIDQDEYCRLVMGTNETEHPGVRNIVRQGTVCIGGEVSLFADAATPETLQSSPRDSRAALDATGKDSFTAFSTRNIPHRGHEFQHRIALDRTDILGIHVITGATVTGSFRSGAVLDIYNMLISEFYPRGRVFLNNLRLPPIYAGPNEAFLQATVLQNLGYTHFVVGRDHAGVGSYYGRYASQEIFEIPSTLGIEILPLPEPHYCPHCDKIATEEMCDRPEFLEKLNGRDVRRLLVEGRHEELAEILRPEIRDALIERQHASPLFIE